MLHSLLLYLEGAARAAAVIDAGIGLAGSAGARIEGLTLVDLRRAHSLLATCESAAYVVTEQDRLRRAEALQGHARAGLTQACLTAGLNFGVRSACGDPLELLPLESRFHDLLIAACPSADDDSDMEQEGLEPRDLVELVSRGAQPLLVVRRRPQPLQRVLLVNDGTAAAGRAIRSFLGLNLPESAECRLLALGESKCAARQSLREMADYCRSRRRDLETGWAVGSPQRLLIPYAEKWQPGLIVMGVTRKNLVLRALLRETAHKVLRTLPCALFAAG